MCKLGHRFKPCFDALLFGENPDVSTSMLPTLPEAMRVLLSDLEFPPPARDPDVEGEEEEKKQHERQLQQREMYRKRVAERVVSLWIRAEGRGWRELAGFLRLLPAIDAALGMPEFNQLALCRSLERLTGGNNEVRKHAADAVCQLLLNNFVASKRKETEGEIVKLAAGKTFVSRVAFLRFCEAAARHFSRRLLSSTKIMSLCISLAEDRVVDVRIGFLKVAKEMFRMALNEETEDLIVEKVDSLRNDKSKDVRNIADSVYTDMKTNAAKYVNEKSAFTINEDIAREEREQGLIKREYDVFSSLMKSSLRDRLRNRSGRPRPSGRRLTSSPSFLFPPPRPCATYETRRARGT